eukprot:m.264446 g.264446  ORF g.264446 m.264446 type:complete len:71 (+) comp27829_c0_seq1:60-272(+)
MNQEGKQTPNTYRKHKGQNEKRKSWVFRLFNSQAKEQEQEQPEISGPVLTGVVRFGENWHQALTSETTTR